MSDTTLTPILVKFKETSWEICKVMKMPKESQFNGALLIFNNSLRSSNWDLSYVLSSKEFKKYNKVDNLHYGRLISIHNNEEAKYFDMAIGEITMLPKSFDNDYEKFLKDNAKMVNNLFSNFCLDKNDIRVKRIYIYTEGSKNFFSWALNLMFKCNVSISIIKDILIWNESYKQLAKNLSKGTITAYTSRDSIGVLLSELSELRKEKRINDSINSFNTAQKKLFKENDLSNDVKQALWRLSRLSDTKRLNFIKKMSSVNDFNELTRQLKFATSVHYTWSKESLMDYLDNVEGINYEKIFENDKIVLIKVLDYETVKQLGKTTNWCITKNKQYWNNYIEAYNGQTTQYMIFDFSKLEDDRLSIVGFTTTYNKGITAAHNFINDNLLGNDSSESVLIKSYIKQFANNKNIYNILSDDGIDITLVAEYDAPLYQWDKKSLFDYLYECVNKDNVDILKDNGDKMVLSVIDQNIKYFFGDAYFDNVPNEFTTLQHIIFIDFSKNKYDANKIQFAIIEEGSGYEEYCGNIYNERSQVTSANFESLLIEYGLPYNIIKRTNNPYVRMRNAMVSFNMPMMLECIQECSPSIIKKTIEDEIGGDTYYDLINRSINDFMSFDYLDLLYNNGIMIKEFLPISYIDSIILQCIRGIKTLSRHTNNFTAMNGVTNEEIKDFYDMKINRREDAKYIGYYLTIKKIVDNERLSPSEWNVVMRSFISNLSSCSSQSEIYEQIFNLVKDKLDLSKDSILHNLANYVVKYGTDGIKEFFNEKAKTSENLRKRIASLEAKEKEPKVKLSARNLSHIYNITVPTTATIEYDELFDNNPF